MAATNTRTGTCSSAAATSSPPSAAAAAVATADVLGLAAAASSPATAAAAAAVAEPSESSGHPPAAEADENDSAYEDFTDDDDDDDDESTTNDDGVAYDDMSLFELISDRHFAAAVGRCRKRPSEARRWDSVRVGGGSPTGEEGAARSQCLPLHRACGLDPTPDLVAALLAAHPAAVAERESYWGRLPLHVACLSGASYDAIQPLLQRYPQGASVVAIHDRLPVHYACGGNAPRRIVLALLKIYPRGARCLDAYGEYRSWWWSGPGIMACLFSFYMHHGNIYLFMHSLWDIPTLPLMLRVFVCAFFLLNMYALIMFTHTFM